MKLNFSLSLKLTLIVVLISIVIVFSISYISITKQEDKEAEILHRTSEQAVFDFARSHSVIQELEVNITNEKLNNTEMLHEYLSNLTKDINNSNILRININTPVNGELRVLESTDLSYNGRLVGDYNNKSFSRGHTFYIIDDQNPIITIISPINISGTVLGTQEIVLSMYPPDVSHAEQIKFMVIVAFISILILIFSLLYLLRKIIVKPIMTLRESAQVIGKGNLNTKVEVNSRDELGDLASAFNQMVKDLEESRDKIQEYNRILEDLLKQKDEFIGQLGHDLKNPLTPLVGLLPIILEQEKDPEIKEHLKIMNHNVQYMRDLIFKTLQLAKLRSSTVEFDIENLNLLEEVGKIIESQKMLLNENNISIEYRISENIYVQADKLRLSEIFKNLITNSVKYSHEVGGRIIIGAWEEEHNFITVGVKDDGLGMTKEQQEQVFSEFYKADEFSSDIESQGLGLAICKRIVEKHGGKIWVKSPGPGLGSVFYFTLKLSSEN